MLRTSVRARDVPVAEHLARHATKPEATGYGKTDIRFGYQLLDRRLQDHQRHRQHRGRDRRDASVTLCKSLGFSRC